EVHLGRVEGQLGLLAFANGAGGVEAGHDLVGRRSGVDRLQLLGHLGHLPAVAPAATGGEVGVLLRAHPLDDVDGGPEGGADGTGAAGQARVFEVLGADAGDEVA